MPRQKWEYQTIEGTDLVILRDAANMMGVEGWELVAVIQCAAGPYWQGERLYFKRPIEQEETDVQGA